MKLFDPTVAFVLGLLALPAVTLLGGLTPGGRDTTTRTRMTELDRALHQYREVRGQYPPTTVGLEALRRPSPDAPLVDPAFRFVDGWGRNLLYEPTYEDGFILTSAGPDGALGTTDDLLVTVNSR